MIHEFLNLLSSGDGELKNEKIFNADAVEYVILK
jgi:hypothetical protein